MMVARNLIAVATLVVVMAGCATTRQEPPATVYVPVVAPKPALPQRPKLAIKDLTADTPIDEVVRAYAMSVQALEGYAAQIEEQCK